MQEENKGNLVTEEKFEDALAEQKKLLRERNPETIKTLNEMMHEARKLSNTLLANFPPEGFIKGAIDSLYLVHGFIGLSLVFFGAGREDVKFLNTKSNEVDEGINEHEQIYEDLYGNNVAKIKMIRMFLLALMAKMDSFANLLTDWDAQAKLGKARTELDNCLIYMEQATYSISYVLTKPAPKIIQAAGGLQL
jgi:hypothetical protein